MIPFTLRQLEYFVAAVEEGSISAAALEMHLSQSAMSTALANLERSVGSQLLVRNHSRGLVLTKPGRRLLEQARGLLRDAEGVLDGSVPDQRAATGNLTVASFSTLAPFLLPRVLVALEESHPALFVQLAEAPTFEALERQLAEASCEVALAYDHGLPDYLTAETIAEVRPNALLPSDHPLAEQPSVSLAALAAEPFVLFDAPQASTYMLSLFRAAGVRPFVRHRTTNVLLLQSLIAGGLGWSILNQLPAQLLSPDGAPFVARPFSEELPALRVVLVYPDGLELTQQASAFVTACRRLAPEALGAATP